MPLTKEEAKAIKKWCDKRYVDKRYRLDTPEEFIDLFKEDKKKMLKSLVFLVPSMIIIIPIFVVMFVITILWEIVEVVTEHEWWDKFRDVIASAYSLIFFAPNNLLLYIRNKRMVKKIMKLEKGEQ